jgi:hypothetical protein
MTTPGRTRQPLEAYKKAAEEFLARRMKDSRFSNDLSDSVPQNMQRRITQDSLTVLQRRRPGFTVFGEMMIVYDDEGKLRHVTPATAVAMVDQDDPQRRSWNWEHETGQLLMVMDYLADFDKYEPLRQVYESSLKVPYCLAYRPSRKELHVFRHNGRVLQPLPADAHGRFEIPELDVKLGVFSGWVRFWHDSRLIPIAEEQDVQLQEKDMLIYEQTANLEEVKDALSQQTAMTELLRRELSEIQSRLRDRVERRARAAGRDDILHQLDASVPYDQLELWLDELS